MLALFPSYVFFCGDESARYTALAAGRLFQVLQVPDQQTLFRDLLGIEQVLGKAELDFYPQTAVGKRCRVAAGPFTGLEGIVVQRAGKTRLVLEVGMLGQGAALEIDADLLESAE